MAAPEESTERAVAGRGTASEGAAGGPAGGGPDRAGGSGATAGWVGLGLLVVFALAGLTRYLETVVPEVAEGTS